MTEEQKIEVLLESAGLKIQDEEERAGIVARYQPLRESIEKLYATPDSRYEDYGLKFEADPVLADWRAP